MSIGGASHSPIVRETAARGPAVMRRCERITVRRLRARVLRTGSGAVTIGTRPRGCRLARRAPGSRMATDVHRALCEGTRPARDGDGARTQSGIRRRPPAAANNRDAATVWRFLAGGEGAVAAGDYILDSTG